MDPKVPRTKKKKSIEYKASPLWPCLVATMDTSCICARVDVRRHGKEHVILPEQPPTLYKSHRQSNIVPPSTASVLATEKNRLKILRKLIGQDQLVSGSYG